MGDPGDPGPEKSRPALEKKPTHDLTTDQRAGILTEAFTHFARSLNAKPEKAINYLGSRRLDYRKLSIGYDQDLSQRKQEK